MCTHGTQLYGALERPLSFPGLCFLRMNLRDVLIRLSRRLTACHLKTPLMLQAVHISVVSSYVFSLHLLSISINHITSLYLLLDKCILISVRNALSPCSQLEALHLTFGDTWKYARETFGLVLLPSLNLLVLRDSTIFFTTQPCLPTTGRAVDTPTLTFALS